MYYAQPERNASNPDASQGDATRVMLRLEGFVYKPNDDVSIPAADPRSVYAFNRKVHDHNPLLRGAVVAQNQDGVFVDVSVPGTGQFNPLAKVVESLDEVLTMNRMPGNITGARLGSLDPGLNVRDAWEALADSEPAVTSDAIGIIADRHGFNFQQAAEAARKQADYEKFDRDTA